MTEAVERSLFKAEAEPNGTQRKLSRREREIQARAASDTMAQVVGRDDIDHSDVESSPTTSVAHLDAVGPSLGSRQGKASIQNWRANRKPLLKPGERK